MISAFGVEHSEISKSMKPANLAALTRVGAGAGKNNAANYSLKSASNVWAKNRASAAKAGKAGFSTTMRNEGRMLRSRSRVVEPDLGRTPFRRQLP